MNPESRSQRLRRVALHHRGLLVVLALHAVVVLLTAGRASTWTTLPMDCLSGAIAETILHEPVWTPWSILDGIVGGQLVAGIAALPLWAVFGTANGMVGKVAAWLFCVGLLVLVYAVVERACGRAGAALAAAGVAFSPPLVFAGSMIVSNWHWNCLLFSYGAALLALSIVWPRSRGPDRKTPHLGLVALGVISGLAVFNSPASLPFIVLVWLFAALGLGVRRCLAGAPAAVLGGAVGLAPLVWRVATFRPAEGGPDRGDPIWQRLFQFRPEWDKLGDLVYPELPVTLHVREALPFLSERLSGGLEVAWVLCCWLGCLLTLVAALEALRRRDRDGGAIAATLVPLSFCAAFVAAYLVIDVRITLLPAEWSEFRQATHRIFPELLVAMPVAAAPGWVWLWRALGRVPGPPLRGGLRALALTAALAAPAIGLFSQGGLAVEAPGFGRGALTAYRGTCWDVPGFFIASRPRPVEEFEAQCRSLSTPARQEDCLAGVALGVGFYEVRLAGEGHWPDDRDDDPCERIPPDLRARCHSWSPESGPVLEGDLEEVCSEQPGLREEICLMGAGWFVSHVAWGREHWPIPACESLGSEQARDGCWAGQGYHVGDHASFLPQRFAQLVGKAPEHRQAAVARGGGYKVGLTWAGEEVARLPCEALEAQLREACLGGVEASRVHAVLE